MSHENKRGVGIEAKYTRTREDYLGSVNLPKMWCYELLDRTRAANTPVPAVCLAKCRAQPSPPPTPPWATDINQRT